MRGVLGLRPMGRFAAGAVVVAVLCSGCSSSGPAGGDAVPLTTVGSAQEVAPSQDPETPAPSTTAEASATISPSTTIAPSTTTAAEPQEADDEDLTDEEVAALLAEYGVEECFLTSLGPCDLDWWEHGPPGCVLDSGGVVDCDGVWFCFDDGWAPCHPSGETAPTTAAPAPTPAVVCPAGWVPVPASYPERAWEGCWLECDDTAQCLPPPAPPVEVYEAARWALAEALAVEPDAVVLIYADPAEWGSSALGCMLAGFGYTAAMENGWRFRYDHSGRTYFVHTSTEWGRLHSIVVVNDSRWRTLTGEPCIDYRSGVQYQ